MKFPACAVLLIRRLPTGTSRQAHGLAVGARRLGAHTLSGALGLSMLRMSYG